MEKFRFGTIREKGKRSFPARLQPLTFGADIVMHSVTKGRSGHAGLLMVALESGTQPDLVRIFP